MSPPEYADAPGGTNSEGANGDLMAGGQDHVQCIASDRQLVGALLWVGPDLRAELLDLLGPGDLEDPSSAAGLEAFRWLHGHGVHEATELIRKFVGLVQSRRKAPRQPGDPLPPRFSGGPESWIADCYRAAADLGGWTGAFALALTVSGWGRRREIAHRAAQLHAIALDRQYDSEDVQEAAEKLIEAVGR